MPKQDPGRIVDVTGSTTMWTGTYFACPDYVAALIVAAKLPLMLAARIHVITPGACSNKASCG